MKLGVTYWFQIFYTNDLHIVWADAYVFGFGTIVFSSNCVWNLTVKITGWNLVPFIWYQIFYTNDINIIKVHYYGTFEIMGI